MPFALDPSWLQLFALCSAVLSLFAYLPYIHDTACGQTQPQRASWLIWSLLGSIAFFSQLHEGASMTLWFVGAQVGGTIIVFLLSIKMGKGAFLTRPDERALWIAIIGLVIWYFTETAVYALALTITISLLGGVLTVIKAYRSPQTETTTTWALSFIASCCAILALGEGDPILIAYPLYLFLLNGAILVAIVIGRATRSNIRYKMLGS